MVDKKRPIIKIYMFVILLAISISIVFLVTSLAARDVEDPNITIMTPASGSLVPAGLLEIDGFASDSSSGVAEVKVRLDNGPFFLAQPKSENWFEWSKEFDISNYGPHNVTAIATDNAGNEKHIVIGIVVERPVDKFGIAMLYPTSDSGREWFSNWDNGFRRELTDSGSTDPYDPEVLLRGSGDVSVDGKGIASANGSPRLYVLDPLGEKKWHDVEITVYFKRVLDRSSADTSSIAFTIATRTEHQDVKGDDKKTYCKGAGIYGRMYYDGRITFRKELVHNIAYSTNKPDNKMHYWDTPDNSLPANVWVGMKLIVKNIDNSSVKLELHRDLMDGLDGGEWEKIIEYTDVGGWMDPDHPDALCPGYPPDRIILEPGTSTYFRIDDIKKVEFKNASIREIKAS